MGAQCSDLPPELIIAITDHLHNDKPSLKACSLVCKAWTYPSRLHLFDEVTLRWPLQPAIFPFVRHLRIIMDCVATWNKTVHLLVGFHCIKSLRVVLSAKTLDAISGDTWSALGNNLSGVQVMCLPIAGIGRVSSVHSLARAICAFPRLQRLYVHGPVQYADLASATTMFRLPPDLDTLELNGGSACAVLDWLISLPVRPTLRTVHLDDCYSSYRPSFQKFTGAFGNDLESISIFNWNESSTHPVIDLAPLTRLRSITLALDIYQSPWATDMLSTISSACLEDVVFKQIYQKRSASDDIHNTSEWHDLDAILQNFPCLRTVCFRFRYSRLFVTSDGPQLSPARASIIQRLPQCHARGILRIDSWL